MHGQVHTTEPGKIDHLPSTSLATTNSYARAKEKVAEYSTRQKKKELEFQIHEFQEMPI